MFAPVGDMGVRELDYHFPEGRREMYYVRPMEVVGGRGLA